MATTEIFYTGDDSTTLFTFPFEYITKDDVKVSINDVDTSEYTYANDTTIQMNSAPTGGQRLRIYRLTNVDDLKATFASGSSIRAQDLNNNFQQNNFAVEELRNYYWDNEVATIHSDETWVSSDTQIATTAAMDQRFLDEADEVILSSETWASNDDSVASTASIDNRIDSKIDTAIEGDILIDATGLTKVATGGQVTLGIGANSVDLDRIKNSDVVTSSEGWPNDDETIATTAKIDDMIDSAIEGDILIDGTGLTKTSSGGQTTLGIGSGAVDFDRINPADIITQAEQNAGAAETDTSIFTSLAAARRFDTLVQTATPTGSQWEVGKTWLQNDDDLTLSIWNGGAWTAITSGGTFTEQPSVVYVDQASGDDNNTGHRISTPKATIKAAIEQINAEITATITTGGSGYVEGDYPTVALTGGTSTGLTADITVGASGVVTAVTLNNTDVLEDYSIGDVLSADAADLGGSGSGLQITVGGDGDGQIVVVSAGTYQEVAPIQIKRRNVSIIGQALRSCLVHPTTATENNILFELNSGSYISNLTLTGMQAGTGTGNTLDATLPTDQGWNFGFYDNAFIVKSPYIQNCTNFSDSEIDNDNLNSHNPAGGGAGDIDSAPTGGGMLVNGAAVHDDSPLRSMVADSYTHVGLNGPGVLVVNNGYAQITSSYAFFNKYHIKCLSGGQANLAASTTDFGDQALVADGRSTNAIFTSTTIADAADQATEFFIEGPTARTATPLPWHGTSTRPQSNMLVDIGGNTYPILSSSNTFDADEIISGRDYTILTVGDTDFTAIGAASNTVGVQFTATGVGTGSGTVTDDTGWRVTISRPDPANRNNNLGLDGAVTGGGAVSFFLRSQVASSGHTMEYVGSGTNYSALPENGGVPDETKQITELNNGKVWTAITDHNGKFKIGGNQTTDPIFEVDQQTGFITIPEGSIAFNLLSDTTPQLGGDLDVNGNTITGLSNPTANDEVANKAYVDSVAGTPTQIAQLNTSVVTSDTDTNGTITFTNDGTESARFDSSRRLLVGTSSGSGDSFLIVRGKQSNTLRGGVLELGRNQAASAPFGSGDDIGEVRFTDNTGGQFASIKCDADATADTDDYPGRLVFSTTADSASSPTERMRIDSSGRVTIGNDTNYSAATGSKLAVELMGTAGTILEIADQTAGFSTFESVKNAGGTDTDYGGYIFSGRRDADDDIKEYLRIDSSGRVGIGKTSLNSTFEIYHATAPYIYLQNSTSGTGAGDGFSAVLSGSDIYLNNRENGGMLFYTNNTERARIDSSGHLLVGGTTAGNAGTRTVSIGSPGATVGGLQLWSTTSNSSYVQFGDGTSTASDHYRGYIGYIHTNDYMEFGTAASERLRISSTGAFGLSGANYGTSGQVLTSQGSGSAPQWATPAGGKILQVVRQIYDTTTSLSVGTTINDVPGVSVSITPASSSSRFIISGEVNGEWANVGYNWGSGVVVGRLIGGTSTWFVPGGIGNRIPGLTIPKLSYYAADANSTPEGWGIANYVDAPATTSTITYRFGMVCQSVGSTFYVNRTVGDVNSEDYNRFRSWITVMEVAD